MACDFSLHCDFEHAPEEDPHLIVVVVSIAFNDAQFVDHVLEVDDDDSADATQSVDLEDGRLDQQFAHPRVNSFLGRL